MGVGRDRCGGSGRGGYTVTGRIAAQAAGVQLVRARVPAPQQPHVPHAVARLAPARLRALLQDLLHRDRAQGNSISNCTYCMFPCLVVTQSTYCETR